MKQRSLVEILVIDLKNYVLSSINAQIKELYGGYWNFDSQCRLKLFFQVKIVGVHHQFNCCLNSVHTFLDVLVFMNIIRKRKVKEARAQGGLK